MDQDTNTGWGTTGTTGTAATTGTTGTGTSGMGAGSTGAGGGFGTTSATDSGVCPHCGQSPNRNAGLEQFLGNLGITPEMINNLKGQLQNVEIDEYLNTARDYLKNTGNKASSFAKENPGKVAAGVAAVALGAGLIYAAVNRDRV